MNHTYIAESTDNYLSDVIVELPSNCLFNKGITGCGGTTLEIQSKRNSLILVPTINLVINKTAAHKNLIGVYGDIYKWQFDEQFNKKTKYKKIIATYDSLPKIIDWIGPEIFNYFLLVDEYHILFSNYNFRHTAVTNVLNTFSSFKRFCFMTATPLTDDTILEELKNLDTHVVEWKETTPLNVEFISDRFTSKSAIRIINESKDKDWNLHIFINSINTIKAIVNSMDSKLSYRTICSKNAKGQDTKQGGKLHVQSINSDVCKINFYTATAFEGVDIYDPVGKTIVISDTNIAQTLMDISTLFIQICGRLRDSKYKEDVIFICNTGNHRYLKYKENSEFMKYADKLEEAATEYEESFITRSKNVQKTDFELYQESKDNYHNRYIGGKNGMLIFDPNLKKLDIQNFNILTRVFNSGLSVKKHLKEQSNIRVKDDIDPIYTEIFNAIPSIKITAKNMRRILIDIFEKYGLISDKDISDFLSTCATKGTMTVDGKKKIAYDFTKLKLMIKQ